MSVVEEPLESASTVPEGCGKCVFTECRKKQLGELEKLFIDGSPAAEVPVAFQDADGEVHFPRIYVDKYGNLRAVLQNRWDDENGNGGYYSMLHYAQELEIWNNPQALCDLVAYAERAYQLGRRWWLQKPPKGMRVTVWCTEADLPMVDQLRKHFRTVEVWGTSAALRMDNVISAGCAHFFFTGCRGVQPRSLTVDAEMEVGGPEFRDADDEARIPHIAIGPRGSLMAVVRNRWGSRCYSLLWHAEALTIRGNPRAVRDLAAYVAGRYETGGPRWPVRQLKRYMCLTIEDVVGCEEEVGALMEYFWVVVVDGKMMQKITLRQMLVYCNGHERNFRSQRAGTEGRRRVLGAAESLLAGKLREVQRAQMRLRERRGQLDAVMLMAE